ncbi:LruC domain-containing protein [Vibrio sp. HN007]|uniref:LruC domain-containing protein n=1 Tax=Vibrio iocasae TaxID=3098914 RepID=UPI0035D4FE9E
MKILLFFLLTLLPLRVISAPFDTCPSKAYLFQATPVQVYGVNLVTGNTTLLQGDTGLNANINGVGFDFNSRYIFGYDTTNRAIVRLGKDFQAETLNTNGLPTDHTFFVGDVFEQHYYLYRKGKGLFKIDLRPLDSDPNAVLDVERISTQADINLTDFAFNPVDNKLYGTDNGSGYLYEFDTNTGNATYVGDTGEKGTFGAGYFDVNGYYYVSRNQDGQIYRIDLSDDSVISQGNVPAIKFADGPYSNQNDGARCANAPVIDEDSNIDFGDAPDSYSTTLASNGPRHELDGLTWLGENEPDGEQGGLVAPLSDDNSGIDDESGVTFITSITAGLDVALDALASTEGYLSGWIDWNQDGDFADAGEQIITDELLSSGNNTIFIIADAAAIEGITWARFRFSQQQGLSYDGGARSGEVEDYQVYVTAAGSTIRHFPSEQEAATIAYEDNWPHKADYDMNDVVIEYHITEILHENSVKKIHIRGSLLAYGADYHNGFAVRLQGLSRDAIDPITTRQYQNGELVGNSGLESDSEEAIFIISEDLSSVKQGQCLYFRTQNSCKQNHSFMFELHINLIEDAESSALIAMPYDPFIFATPGYYHGEQLPFQPGRSWELHLPDHSPTEKFNHAEMWGLGIDASNTSEDTYFKTSNNLPWAILIPGTWKWPEERVDLLTSYPRFATFAESAGQNGKDWYRLKHANQSKTYNP